jgi:hypothetical protein
VSVKSLGERQKPTPRFHAKLAQKPTAAVRLHLYVFVSLRYEAQRLSDKSKKITNKVRKCFQKVWSGSWNLLACFTPFGSLTVIETISTESKT